MTTYDEACMIAFSYFARYGLTIKESYETDNLYFFYGKQAEDDARSGVCVSKLNGNLYPVTVQIEPNCELVHSGQKITVPQKYINPPFSVEPFAENPPQQVSAENEMEEFLMADAKNLSDEDIKKYILAHGLADPTTLVKIMFDFHKHPDIYDEFKFFVNYQENFDSNPENEEVLFYHGAHVVTVKAWTALTLHQKLKQNSDYHPLHAFMLLIKLRETPIQIFNCISNEDKD